METLQIAKENALKAHKEANENGKSLLENLFGKKTFLLSIFDRIKTIEDCFEEVNISKSEFDAKYKGLPESIYNFALLTEIIVPALNEGWEPDWDNGNQYKYYAWFDMSGSGGGFSCADYGVVCTGSGVGARLVFKSSELAKYAGTQFINVYRAFMTK